MIIATTLAGPGAESSIGDALRSALPLADEFLLIFAGCDSDATLAVAAKAVPERPIHIEHLVWPGDYGKARNFALEQATALGADWALTLDVDERLEIDPGELRALDLPQFDVVSVHDRDLHYQKPRFLRCSAGLQWWGIVHERLQCNERRMAGIPGCFWELEKGPEAERRRWQRGLEATPKMLAERDDPAIRRHFAECLLSDGREAEAREQFVQVSSSLQTPLNERTWCEYRLAEFECVAGDYVSARARAASALARDPGFIQELGWVLAHCAAQLKEFQTAALWASYALLAPLDMSRGGHRGVTWRQGCTRLLEAIQEAAERVPGRPEPTSHTQGGIVIPFTDQVSPEMRRIIRAGGYEAAERAALSDVLKPGDRVLELGTGIGFLATACARIVGNDSVTTVEANPGMADSIRECFRLNDVHPRLIVACVARESGQSRKVEQAHNFWSTRVSESGPGIEVPTIAFRDLLAVYRPTVLVCDIEGSEIELIGEPIPASVRAIIIEAHSKLLVESVSRWLLGCGFIIEAHSKLLVESVSRWLLGCGFEAQQQDKHSVLIFTRSGTEG